MGILVFLRGVSVFSLGISVNPGHFGNSMYRNLSKTESKIHCLQLFANLVTLWSSHCSRKTWFLNLKTRRYKRKSVIAIQEQKKTLLFFWNCVQLLEFNLLRKFRQHDNIICHLKRKLIIRHNVLPSVVDSGSSHP